MHWQGVTSCQLVVDIKMSLGQCSETPNEKGELPMGKAILDIANSYHEPESWKITACCKFRGADSFPVPLIYALLRGELTI